MAGEVLIGTPNYALGSGVTASGGTTPSGLPVSNVLEKSPSKFARWNTKDPQETYISLDLGQERKIGAVALVMVGGAGAAVQQDDDWRVRLDTSPIAAPNPVAPTSIEVSTNLTGSVSDINDDPDDPDGNWLTATTAEVDVVLRVRFPPAGALKEGASLQEFRVLARVDPDGDSVLAAVDYIKLLQNGTELTDITGNLGLDSNQGDTVFSARWDAALLTGTSNVEMEIAGRISASGFSTSMDIGAVRWNQALTFAGHDSGIQPVPYSLADSLWGDSLASEVGPLANPVLVYVPPTEQTARYVRFDIRLGATTSRLDVGVAIAVPAFRPAEANVKRDTPFAGVEYLAKPSTMINGRVVIGSEQPPKRLLRVSLPYLGEAEYRSLHQRLFLSGQRVPVLVSIQPTDTASHQISTAWAEVANDGRSFPGHHLPQAKDGKYSLEFVGEEIK